MVHAIKAESQRRALSGQAARESAAKIHVRAPQVLGMILDDTTASPRYRIESAKELRATASGAGAEGAAEASERFHIVINLGSDTEVYEKSRAVKPHDDRDEQPLKIVVDNDAHNRELENDG